MLRHFQCLQYVLLPGETEEPHLVMEVASSGSGQHMPGQVSNAETHPAASRANRPDGI